MLHCARPAGRPPAHNANLLPPGSAPNYWLLAPRDGRRRRRPTMVPSHFRRAPILHGRQLSNEPSVRARARLCLNNAARYPLTSDNISIFRRRASRKLAPVIRAKGVARRQLARSRAGLLWPEIGSHDRFATHARPTGRPPTGDQARTGAPRPQRAAGRQARPWPGLGLHKRPGALRLARPSSTSRRAQKDVGTQQVIFSFEMMGTQFGAPPTEAPKRGCENKVLPRRRRARGRGLDSLARRWPPRTVGALRMAETSPDSLGARFPPRPVWLVAATASWRTNIGAPQAEVGPRQRQGGLAAWRLGRRHAYGMQSGGQIRTNSALRPPAREAERRRQRTTGASVGPALGALAPPRRASRRLAWRASRFQGWPLGATNARQTKNQNGPLIWVGLVGGGPFACAPCRRAPAGRRTNNGPFRHASRASAWPAAQSALARPPGLAGHSAGQRPLATSAPLN